VFGCLNIQMHRTLKDGSISQIKFGDFLLPSHWIMKIFVLPFRVTTVDVILFPCFTIS
jgi:hypothetical protein